MTIVVMTTVVLSVEGLDDEPESLLTMALAMRRFWKAELGPSALREIQVTSSSQEWSLSFDVPLDGDPADANG